MISRISSLLICTQLPIRIAFCWNRSLLACDILFLESNTALRSHDWISRNLASYSCTLNPNAAYFERRAVNMLIKYLFRCPFFERVRFLYVIVIIPKTSQQVPHDFSTRSLRIFLCQSVMIWRVQIPIHAALSALPLCPWWEKNSTQTVRNWVRWLRIVTNWRSIFSPAPLPPPPFDVCRSEIAFHVSSIEYSKG